MPTESRLDRLTALVVGLMPRIDVAFAGDLPRDHVPAADDAKDVPADLHIQLLVTGVARIDSGADAALAPLRAPAIAIFDGNITRTVRPQPGEHCRLLSASVRFEGPAAPLLLDAFAVPLYLPLEDAAADLRQVVELISVELDHPCCGGGILLNRAAEILLVTLLRHLVGWQMLPRGVLAGLGDPGLARALVAMHEQPAAPWSIERMAEVAGMSRTAFALRFRERLGITPRRYLNAYRMTIARREIDAGRGLKRAAQAAGYESSSALSRALSRAHGAVREESAQLVE